MATVPHLEFERDIVEIQGQIDKLLDLANRKGIDVSDELSLLGSKLENLDDEAIVGGWARLNDRSVRSPAHRPDPRPHR